MKRIQFLKNLFGTAALLVAPKLPLSARPKGKAVLLSCTLAGLPYYVDPPKLQRMRCGEPLQLHREPENPYDEKAIAVHYKGEKIGFIPRAENEMLSTLLDQRLLHITAEISDVDADASLWDAVELSVFATRQE